MTKPAKPNWNNLPAAHVRRGRNGVFGIVLHDTAGSGTHNDTVYLQNPGDGRIVSVDFTVERDGSIWKLNPDLGTYFCLHAGRATSWRGYKNRAVNRATIGIEIVQHKDLALSPVYPRVQVRSVAQLCAWLTSEYQLASADITTHRQIITDGSRSDPRRFPFDGPQGFWRFYWEAYGRASAFVGSLSGNPERRRASA